MTDRQQSRYEKLIEDETLEGLAGKVISLEESLGERDRKIGELAKELEKAKADLDNANGTLNECLEESKEQLEQYSELEDKCKSLIEDLADEQSFSDQLRMERAGNSCKIRKVVINHYYG